MKSITINGTRFTEIDYILDGEEMPGILIHDEHDTNSDGDMIVGNGCELPDNEEEAAVILTNETGISAFHMEGGRYIVD